MRISEYQWMSGNTVIMEDLSRYWKICQISLTQERTGYETRSLPLAQAFLQSQLSDSAPAQASLQTILLSHFQTQHPAIAPAQRAQAGLCLRCNVSYPLLKACQKIDNLYSGDKQFTYHDLLPFVLNDDGKDLIIIDSDGKTQLKLEHDSTLRPTPFKPFTVEVLRTFKADSPASMSLENWAFLKAKQCPELKYFLSEFGFQHLSDWALLNRARAKQLEPLSERDRLLVEAFHAVYRRDRRQKQQIGKCADPNRDQLTEMRLELEKHGMATQSPGDVLKALKQVAQQLRQADIWSYRTPLEVQNIENGHYELRHDLPTQAFDALEMEQQEFLEFLRQQLQIALADAIEQGIAAHLQQLENSRKYAAFASSFIAGLQRYYCQGMSLREIAPQLGMSSWDQARRVLNPGELLSKIRSLTLQQLFDQTLKKAQAQGLVSASPEPSYLKALAEQIEAFTDTEIFAEAATEIKAGKSRLMKSEYAQQLKRYFAQHAARKNP
jgi:hypothetical protein